MTDPKPARLGLLRRSLAALVLIALPGAALAERVALVIGNGAYVHTTPLANPRNDATAMAAKLRSLGFETVEGLDLSKMEMAEKVREFARASRDAELALFYYAGHAMEVDGRNYLLPVDAALHDELSIDLETFPIDVVTRQMSYTDGANLIFLDACRDNPLAQQLSRSLGGSTRSIGTPGALAQMDVADTGFGTGIAFATAPGLVAADGTGRHSPFTEALLRHIGAPNVPITSVMNRVTGDVYEATNQTQRPWFNQSFTADVILNPVASPVSAGGFTISAVHADGKVTPSLSRPVTVPPTQTAPAATADDERFMFEIARQSGLAADYRAYLDFYPDGRYAPFARNMLARLQAAPADAAPGSTASAAPGAGTRAVAAYDPTAPLMLSATATLRGMPATDVTEQALALDAAARRAIQARLNATGNSVGRPDGVFGPNTRAGLRGWQIANGLPPTGHLNSAQLDLLTVQTESVYAAYLTAPAASAAGSTRATTSSANRRPTASRPQTPAIVNDFVRGVGEGVGNKLGEKLFR